MCYSTISPWSYFIPLFAATRRLAQRTFSKFLTEFQKLIELKLLSIISRCPYLGAEYLLCIFFLCDIEVLLFIYIHFLSVFMHYKRVRFCNLVVYNLDSIIGLWLVTMWCRILYVQVDFLLVILKWTWNYTFVSKISYKINYRTLRMRCWEQFVFIRIY